MVILKPDALYSLKVSSNLQRSQNVVLPSFCSFPKNKKGEHFNFLDVRKCFIIRYLEVIGSCRSSCNFWFCIVAPKKGVKASRSTIARWIRKAIFPAYNHSVPLSPVSARGCRSVLAASV